MQALDIIRSLSEENRGNDAAEAAALLGEHFKHKYISPIKRSFEEKCSYCGKNPSPQVNLLRAFMPFVKDKTLIERMAELMTKYDAATEMVKEYYNKNKNNSEKTIIEKNEKNFFLKENSAQQQNMPVIAILMLIVASRIQ